MKQCLLLLLAAAVVSCAPPYSAELNSSAKLAGQMTLLGTIGPVNSPDGSSTTAIKFLPTKPSATTTSLSQLGATSGFLVAESQDREGLSFAIQSGDSVQVLNTGASFSLTGADPNYPLYQYDVITTTTTANIIVSYLGTSSSLGVTTYQCFTAALPNGPLQAASSPPTSYSSVFPGNVVLATQVFPLSAAPYDRFNFLISVGALYGDGNASFALPLFSGGATTTNNVPLAAGFRAFYYQGPLGSPSYASYFTAGSWVCDQWTLPTSSIPTRLTSVTRRIDAVLTDGDLISTQDGTLTVYDFNGNELNSVPLGGMQFCYEAYVGTTPYVFFSLSLGFSHQSWAFRVYAVPTTALRGLKG